MEEPRDPTGYYKLGQEMEGGVEKWLEREMVWRLESVRKILVKLGKLATN